MGHLANISVLDDLEQLSETPRLVVRHTAKGIESRESKNSSLAGFSDSGYYGRQSSVDINDDLDTGPTFEPFVPLVEHPEFLSKITDKCGTFDFPEDLFEHAMVLSETSDIAKDIDGGTFDFPEDFLEHTKVLPEISDTPKDIDGGTNVEVQHQLHTKQSPPKGEHIETTEMAMVQSQVAEYVPLISPADQHHIDVLELMDCWEAAASDSTEGAAANGPESPSTYLSTDDEDETSEDDSSYSSTTASMDSPRPRSPNAAEGDGLVSSLLPEYQCRLIDRVMTEVHSLLNQQIQLRSRSGSAESSSSQPGSARTGGSGPGSSSGQKHSLESGSGANPSGSGNGEGFGGDRPSKRLQINAEIPEIRLRNLVCPYYQRNPSRYAGNRSCSGPGWKSSHRVK
jgi:hypothetical protein